MATAWLLLVADGKFGELLDSVEGSLYLVEALGAPYDVKDSLKGAGFIWNGDDKIWHTSVKGDAALQDLAQFLSRLYPSARESMRIVQVPSNLRHANTDFNSLPRSRLTLPGKSALPSIKQTTLTESVLSVRAKASILK